METINIEAETSTTETDTTSATAKKIHIKQDTRCHTPLADRGCRRSAISQLQIWIHKAELLQINTLPRLDYNLSILQ